MILRVNEKNREENFHCNFRTTVQLFSLLTNRALLIETHEDEVDILEGIESHKACYGLIIVRPPQTFWHSSLNVSV
jgi:hypothetical protein